MAKAQNTIDRLAGELKKLSEQVAPRVDLARSDIDRIELEAFLAGEESWTIYGGPGNNILLLSQDRERMASLATLIQGQFPDELSQRFVEDKLIEAMLALKGKEGDELWESLKKRIGDLIAEVRSSPSQHEVIFPIINLALEKTGPLDFGPLTLHPREEGDLIAELTRDLDHPLLGDAGLKAVKAYGTANVRARDPIRMQNNALDLAEIAFNVIRLFRNYESYRWRGIIRVVAVQESALRVVWHRPIDHSLVAKDQRHAYRIGPLGAGAPFTIRPEGLHWMRRWGFDEIASLCFSEPGNDDVHRRIRDSVRWAGQAKIAQDNQARFLGQWIALEVLLNPYEQNPVGRDVSDAAAFLLSKPAVESRMCMAKHFRRFWRTRIGIVHQGKSASEEECEALASDVTRAVGALSRKHATGIMDIREWFESQKYSVVSDT